VLALAVDAVLPVGFVAIGVGGGGGVRSLYLRCVRVIRNREFLSLLDGGSTGRTRA